MRRKSKARKYIDPDAFYVARKRAGLTRDMAAEMLDVDVKTIGNWENGLTAIPYAAFRLMRLKGGYGLLNEGWEGWALWEGKLFSPAGRSFAPYELIYLSNYISMARLFIKSREIVNIEALQNAHIVRGSASDATASTGARRCHDAVVIAVDFSQQKIRSSLKDSLQFAEFDTYRDAANEACYG
jgi:DNA-binding XRE family transcriptional regulator